jgi:hypothetical protein
VAVGFFTPMAASVCRSALNGITLKVRRHSAVATTATSAFSDLFSPRPGWCASGDRFHKIAGKRFLVVSD